MPGSHKSSAPSGPITPSPGIKLHEKKVSDQNVSQKTFIETPESHDNMVSSEYPRGPRLALVTMAVALTVFVSALDQTIVGTAIPKITDDFGSLDKVAWFGTAYFMTSGGFQSSWGKLSKMFPLKIVYLGALFIFEIGSLLCGVAPNANAFIVGRAIAGLGAAGLLAGGMTVIALSTSLKRRPIFMGIVSSTYGIAAVCGPLIGGAFTDNVTWRWCFYINLPIGGVSALAVLFFYKSQNQQALVDHSFWSRIKHIDLVGAVLLMGAIVTFTLAFEYGGQMYTWNSSIVIGLLVGFVMIFAAFMLWEVYQGDQAMIPARLIRRRPIWTSACFQFCFASAYFLALYYIPEYFQSVDNISPLDSGVRNLPLVISVSISTMASGFLVSRFDRTAPLMVLGSALVTVGSGLFITFDKNTSAGEYIGYQILAGVGWGATWQMALLTIQANSEKEYLSTAIALSYTFQTLSGAFSLAAAQGAFINTLIKSLAESTPSPNPGSVIQAGATGFRSSFPPEQVPIIVKAYTSGVRVTFIMMTAIAGTAFTLSFLQSWRRLHEAPASRVSIKR